MMTDGVRYLFAKTDTGRGGQIKEGFVAKHEPINIMMGVEYRKQWYVFFKKGHLQQTGEQRE